MVDSIALGRAAGLLLDAEQRARPLEGLGGLIEAASTGDGYRVQTAGDAARRAAGAVSLGWKVGLTSPGAQQAFGADEPMFGRLYADRRLSPDTVLELDRLCAPKLEGEIILKVGAPPAVGADDAALLDSIESVHAAFEVADSRYRDWRFGIGEAIADNACCALFGVNEEGVAPRLLEMASVAMTIMSGAEVVSSGVGANCLGSPLASYAWLVRALAERGLALRTGELILTGALGPMVPLEPGRDYRVDLAGLGSFRISAHARAGQG